MSQPANKYLSRYLTDRVPIIQASVTVRDAKQYLLNNLRDFTAANYLYVIDKTGELVNVVSVRELYGMQDETVLSHLHKKSPLVTIYDSERYELAVYLAVKHNIKSIPVVTSTGKLIGIISNDSIISILYKKLHGDLFRLAGIRHAHADFRNAMEIPFGTSIRHRLPWLVAGLLGGVAASAVIGSFEHIIKQNIILAAFIPLVVYIADAVGTQLEAYTIRDFAIMARLRLGMYIRKQISVVLAISLMLGAAIGIISLLLQHQLRVSLVLGLSVFAASLSSVITGLAVPSVLRKLKQDPASASGPIGTIIQDILSIVVYFAIATWLLL